VIRSGTVGYRDGTVTFSDEAVEYVRELFEHDEHTTGGYVAAIVLDPGHGGRDPGASHSHTIGDRHIDLIEKDIVLGVARDLYALLEARYPDREIVLTRKGDEYLKLEERVAIANEISINPVNEIMVFVSIHANASLNPSTYGYEVWYLPPEYGRTNLVSSDEVGEGASSVLPILNLMRDEEYTTESITLAQSILDAFDESVGDESRDLGLKEESWFVVRNAKMPSILVELGYLTNSREAQNMSDEEYLRKLTVALYNGITRFVEDFETRYRTIE
jgi:N-acetylmuramoyl-L-alanine amidase